MQCVFTIRKYFTVFTTLDLEGGFLPYSCVTSREAGLMTMMAVSYTHLSSHFFSELQADPSLAIDFIIAPPRMAYYMEYSTRIYQIYLKYIAPELSLIHISVQAV